LLNKSVSILKYTSPRSFSKQWTNKVAKQIDHLVPEPNIDFFKGQPDLYKNQLKVTKKHFNIVKIYSIILLFRPKRLLFKKN
jgi:hypothetical protein